MKPATDSQSILIIPIGKYAGPGRGEPRPQYRFAAIPADSSGCYSLQEAQRRVKTMELEDEA